MLLVAGVRIDGFGPPLPKKKSDWRAPPHGAMLVVAVQPETARRHRVTTMRAR